LQCNDVLDWHIIIRQIGCAWQGYGEYRMTSPSDLP
jgi:hypothetical protein